MKKYLTEAQAWKLIAKKFFGPSDYSTRDGLCYCADYIADKGKITQAMSEKMNDRVEAYIKSGHSWAYPISDSRIIPFWWSNDTSTEARKARGMAALWFAEEARSEE